MYQFLVKILIGDKVGDVTISSNGVIVKYKRSFPFVQEWTSHALVKSILDRFLGVEFINLFMHNVEK